MIYTLICTSLNKHLGILWYCYLHQNSSGQRPPILISSVSEAESFFGESGGPETISASNPLLKYCNIPSLDNFVGEEGYSQILIAYYKVILKQIYY